MLDHVTYSVNLLCINLDHDTYSVYLLCIGVGPWHLQRLFIMYQCWTMTPTAFIYYVSMLDHDTYSIYYPPPMK